jgi:predicted nucleic acid-binding protein
MSLSRRAKMANPASASSISCERSRLVHEARRIGRSSNGNFKRSVTRGSLNLPSAGETVYVDAQVIIYTVEPHADYIHLLEPLWQAAKDGSIKVVSSELSLMETLILPIRAANTALQSAYEQVLTQGELTLLPVSDQVLREAAALRAQHASLRTPDAIHAATAVLHKCSLLVTNDLGLKNRTKVPIAVLKDLI